MVIKVLQYIMTVVMTVCDNILKLKVVIVNQKTGIQFITKHC